MKSLLNFEKQAIKSYKEYKKTNSKSHLSNLYSSLVEICLIILKTSKTYKYLNMEFQKVAHDCSTNLLEKIMTGKFKLNIIYNKPFIYYLSKNIKNHIYVFDKKYNKKDFEYAMRILYEKTSDFKEESDKKIENDMFKKDCYNLLVSIFGIDDVKKSFTNDFNNYINKDRKNQILNFFEEFNNMNKNKDLQEILLCNNSKQNNLILLFLLSIMSEYNPLLLKLSNTLTLDQILIILDLVSNNKNVRDLRKIDIKKLLKNISLIRQYISGDLLNLDNREIEDKINNIDINLVKKYFSRLNNKKPLTDQLFNSLNIDNFLEDTMYNDKRIVKRKFLSFLGLFNKRQVKKTRSVKKSSIGGIK